jgi:hypothetical protein
MEKNRIRDKHSESTTLDLKEEMDYLVKGLFRFVVKIENEVIASMKTLTNSKHIF